MKMWANQCCVCIYSIRSKNDWTLLLDRMRVKEGEKIQRGDYDYERDRDRASESKIFWYDTRIGTLVIAIEGPRYFELHQQDWPIVLPLPCSFRPSPPTLSSRLLSFLNCFLFMEASISFCHECHAITVTCRFKHVLFMYRVHGKGLGAAQSAPLPSPDCFDRHWRGSMNSVTLSASFIHPKQPSLLNFFGFRTTY